MGCGNRINEGDRPVYVQQQDGTYTPIVGLISDTVERQPRLDASTHALAMIDYAHYGVHRGDHYFVSSSVILALTNDTLGLTVVVPDTTSWAHMLWEVSSSGPITVQLYEGSSGISLGDAVTPYNSNRNSTNTSGLVVKKDPTVATPGTLLSQAAFGAAGAKAYGPSGGIVARESELILKQNTAYYLKVTADGDSVTVTYHAEWYMHVVKG